MEEVDGVTVKDWLRRNLAHRPSAALEVARMIGEAVAAIHSADMVHGDLTTSNLMLRGVKLCPQPPSDQEGTTDKDVALGNVDGESNVSLVVLDFGLGSGKLLPEDKAVDLYVLERAFASTHRASEFMVAEICRVYSEKASGAKATMQRLADVQKRGRKREMFG